jgi:hypothetical protein
MTPALSQRLCTFVTNDIDAMSFADTFLKRDFYQNCRKWFVMAEVGGQTKHHCYAYK